MEFLARNPLIMIGLVCACWPGLLPLIAAYYIGRRGMPLLIRWRGWQQPQADEDGYNDL